MKTPIHGSRQMIPVALACLLAAGWCLTPAAITYGGKEIRFEAEGGVVVGFAQEGGERHHERTGAGVRSQTAPGSTKPAADSPYGVVAHVTRLSEHGIAQREFELMKQAGIEWVRTDCDWDRVENPQGQWHYAHMDETVKWADAAGIKLLLQLNYDVPWARPAHQHMDKWLTYVRNVVGRYKGSVRHWEVWNEPNGEWFWKPPSARDYAAFLKETHRTIKGIDPGLQVVFGGTFNIDVGYIEDALKVGAGGYFDVMSVHPYGTAVDNTGNDLARLVDLMKRYGVDRKPIWITEWGWPAVNNDVRQENEHAVNLAIGWHLALHGMPVQRLFWYEFRSEEGKPGDREHYFGLVRNDLKPRPTYAAYKALIRARPPGSKTDEGDWWRQGLTWTHWIRPDGMKGWSVWAWSGQADYRVTVRGRCVEAFDHLGRPLKLKISDGAVEITLRRAPIYLIGPDQLSFEETPAGRQPGN